MKRRKPTPKVGTRLWKVRAIIAESKRHYLIDWEDDSDGKSYTATWELKKCANDEAVAHWTETKRAKASQASCATQHRRVRGIQQTKSRGRAQSKPKTSGPLSDSKRREVSGPSSMKLSDTDRQKTAKSEEQMWRVRDILKERADEYLIAWESDADTGKQYKPTWEPKSYANDEAVAHWEAKKKKSGEEIWNRQLSGQPQRTDTVPKNEPAETRPKRHPQVARMSIRRAPAGFPVSGSNDESSYSESSRPPAKRRAETRPKRHPQVARMTTLRTPAGFPVSGSNDESSDSESSRPPAKRRATPRSRKRVARTPPRPQVAEWKVKSIISEDKKYYLVEWESDPNTGQDFMPTWEPKSFANKEAVAHWERKKKIMSNSKAAKSVRSVTAARTQTTETLSAQVSPLRKAPFLFQRSNTADTPSAHATTPRRAPTFFGKSNISQRPMVEPDYDTEDEYDTFSSSSDDMAYDTAASTQKHSKFDDSSPTQTSALPEFYTGTSARKRSRDGSSSLSSLHRTPTPPYSKLHGTYERPIKVEETPPPQTPTPLFSEEHIMKSEDDHSDFVEVDNMSSDAASISHVSISSKSRSNSSIPPRIPLLRLKPPSKPDNEEVLVKDEEVDVKDEEVLVKDEKVFVKDDEVLVKDEEVPGNDEGVLVKDKEVLVKNEEMETEDQEEALPEVHQEVSSMNTPSLEGNDQIPGEYQHTEHENSSPNKECAVAGVHIEASQSEKIDVDRVSVTPNRPNNPDTFSDASSNLSLPAALSNREAKSNGKEILTEDHEELHNHDEEERTVKNQLVHGDRPLDDHMPDNSNLGESRSDSPNISTPALPDLDSLSTWEIVEADIKKMQRNTESLAENHISSNDKLPDNSQSLEDSTFPPIHNQHSADDPIDDLGSVRTSDVLSSIKSRSGIPFQSYMTPVDFEPLSTSDSGQPITCICQKQQGDVVEAAKPSARAQLALQGSIISKFNGLSEEFLGGLAEKDELVSPEDQHFKLQKSAHATDEGMTPVDFDPLSTSDSGQPLTCICQKQQGDVVEAAKPSGRAQLALQGSIILKFNGLGEESLGGLAEKDELVSHEDQHFKLQKSAHATDEGKVYDEIL